MREVWNELGNQIPLDMTVLQWIIMKYKRDLTTGRFVSSVKRIRCSQCGEWFIPRKKYSKFCSRECFDKARADRRCIVLDCDRRRYAHGLCSLHYQRYRRKGSPRAKVKVYDGSGWITSNGYRGISVNGKHVYEHRYVMEQFLGRKLPTGWDVHHRNGNKTDNRISNLEIVEHAEHTRIENTKEPRFCMLCGKRHYAKGYCKQHYMRERRKAVKGAINCKGLCQVRVTVLERESL
jgi:hypothetical protein